MPLFKGLRVNRTNGAKAGRGDNPHPVNPMRPSGMGGAMPPRPNPAARFAPKPDNPQTIKRGNELGAGYESAKKSHDTYMMRADNAQNPQDRARHLKQADEMKRVMGHLDSQITENAKKGDIWRSKY